MITENDIHTAIDILRECTEKLEKRIENKRKSMENAMMMGIISNDELTADEREKIKAFNVAEAVLNERLAAGKSTVAKNVTTTETSKPGSYKCPYCGLEYKRKISICYDGCKKRLWEDE